MQVSGASLASLASLEKQVMLARKDQRVSKGPKEKLVKLVPRELLVVQGPKESLAFLAEMARMAHRD